MLVLVTGSDTGAKRTVLLSILVGGSRRLKSLHAVIPKAWEPASTTRGGSGCSRLSDQMRQPAPYLESGSHYAKAKGLDLRRSSIPLSTGAAGSNRCRYLDPKILAGGDYAPGFFLKHYVKDMKIALPKRTMSNLSGRIKPGATTTNSLQAEGCGDLGTQA